MGLMTDAPDEHYDLAIVDPPYGIEMGGNAQIKSLKSRPKWEGCKYKTKEWDKVKPDKTYFNELFRISKDQVVWGGNYFTTNLTETNSWIVWDKKMSHNVNFSHCELAWTSLKRSMKLFSYTATGYSKNKIHPTQKPVSLYRWLLTNYAKPGQTIVDTHGGSFSSAIACWHEGYDMDICEIDNDYFEDACERFERETRQHKLFPISGEGA